MMKNVLFVCIENACRSQMAEAWARHLGRGRLNAFSAGSRPAGSVNPRAIEVMRERGIELTGHQSKGFDALPALTWDYVITMGCGDDCPFVPARARLDWNIPDPKGKSLEEFRQVRDEIERRVRQLLEQL
ncbi:MAG: arsenate reductase ArsC [Acidobacteria bacterium]|nr:MAG: arsenate reductase ArsC [Acidobacteriota bacterium]